MPLEIDTTPLPRCLDEWEGKWIAAAADGRIVGAWSSPEAMAREVPALGLGDQPCLLYVARPDEPVWSVLYRGSP